MIIYQKYVVAYPNHNIDALLDNIMIYYLTNSATTAGRLYAEAMSPNQRSYDMMRVPVRVPTACARFEHDILHSLDWQLRDKYPNLVQSTWHKDGGHFAVIEEPMVLYEDFISFVNKIYRTIAWAK